MTLAKEIPLVLELLGVLLDVLLLGVVALFLFGELPGERRQLLPLGALDGRRISQLCLHDHLLAPVLVLADHLGLVERPLIRRLLLLEQHLLHGVVRARRRDRQDDRVDRGRERDAPAEGLGAALVELLGIWNLDLSHSGRSPDGSPPAWRRGPPRRRSSDAASAPRRARGSCPATRRRGPAPRTRPPAPGGPRRRRARTGARAPARRSSASAAPRSPRPASRRTGTSPCARPIRARYSW